MRGTNNNYHVDVGVASRRLLANLAPCKFGRPQPASGRHSLRRHRACLARRISCCFNIPFSDADSGIDSFHFESGQLGQLRVAQASSYGPNTRHPGPAQDVNKSEPRWNLQESLRETDVPNSDLSEP